MSFQLSIIDEQVFTALRGFIRSVLGDDYEVVQGQANLVPEVTNENFTVMTPRGRDRLSTNVITYEYSISDQLSFHEQSTQLSVQLSMHGPISGDQAQIVTTLFFDAYGVDFFHAQNLGVTPLYCTTPQQIPFINGEQQYENQWVFSAEMQVKPIVSAPQDFFTSINVRVINVDAQYPPT